ncbi:MAG TPA: pyridoxamine 5'-phosphate oxidase family protein [Anaerolineales bacterium]|nr:pyridoxamine 5'-phosphate oxidase family protein [Anaerolineales bacterium]
MFREMRRKKQLLSEAETIEILKTSTSGVLGVTGDDGYPYTVPLSHVYQDGKLFFHCALEGHKIDGITRNDKVSFCVIDQDQVIPEKFATHYRSAIVFGKARFLTDEGEKRRALESLVARFSPEYRVEGQQEIERDLHRTCIIEVKIEHLTGKAAKEIANTNQGSSQSES